MANSCAICGKKPVTGNTVRIRGKAKYLGGVGTKVTGISRRKFKPNLQTLHVTVNKTNKTLRVCTQCIRSGAVTKRVRNAPFKLPAGPKPADGDRTGSVAKAAAKARPAAKPSGGKSAAAGG
jgi:large subunit ribosomal protein L28